MAEQETLFSISEEQILMTRITGIAEVLQSTGFGNPSAALGEDGPFLSFSVTDRQIPVILQYRLMEGMDPETSLERYLLVATARLPKDGRENYAAERFLWENGLLLSHPVETGDETFFFLRASMPEYGEFSPEALAVFMNQLVEEIALCP